MAGALDNTAQNRSQLSPMALALADAARLLSAAGSQVVTVEMLQADLDAGAPANPDGTINLVRYAAWLVKQQAVRPLGCSAVSKGSRPQAESNSLTVQQPNSLRAGGSHD